MAAKSIIEVDVNDEKFLSFMDKFNEYQAALEELPEAWRASAQGIGDSARETSKASSEAEGMTKAFLDGVDALNMMVNNLDRINTSLDDANKRQSDLNKKTAGSSSIFGKLKKDSKEFAGHIKDATVSLLSWGGIVGLFTGVLGAGGLFGLNRLASTASAQRFTSMGLNTSIGALDSTTINYQRAVANPTATLGAIRDTQADLSQRWKFQAMGINNPDRSPDQLLPEMIRAARSIFTQTGGTLQGANAYGLTSFFSIDDLNRFKNMSDAEIDAMEKRAKRDAQLLQITDEQARQWQDFNVQLDYSSQSIKNTFIRGLGPLTPGLTKLSDALSGAIDTVLQSPELGKWIDGLAGGIQRFGDYLASPDFKNDVDSFMSLIKEMGLTVDNFIKFVKGETINDWMKMSEDSANSTADWIKDKTGFDTRSVGPAVNNFFSGGWEKIKNAFASGDITPVDSTPANVNAKGRTIADRFNNPGNLRWAEGYETSNTKSGKFAVFPSLDEGVLAATKQLQIYAQRGTNTVRDIVSKWAPSNENNTEEYIRHVVRSTKFNENEKLNLNDPYVLAKLISAMASKEGAGSRVTEDRVIQIYNNTGGNAIVTGAQLGAMG
ncbi:hypothetical protein DUQ06_07865 [Salmonella enterica subsp. diarizonae]|uniref:Lytic transglycosylase domain-containing protein n=1 Tax=Salmonella enterica TaxID=28901 RepID=A0A403SWB3_SALER|nr:hypothetical protein [Salmonella enterica subsp. diarizonae]EFP2796718.1 hypothetical protein [Salmonella enterica]EHQ9195704.1 hypothetical protein [Salmonella enterica subsp. diarizonae serovar 50:k:z:[z50],[z57],[z68], [z86]]ECJ2315762.1 hypothetical protein [Salmonella enterica subsp. diarizonae]EHK0865004.1 hypothetical protein [Salmonella enterica]